MAIGCVVVRLVEFANYAPKIQSDQGAYVPWDGGRADVRATSTPLVPLGRPLIGRLFLSARPSVRPCMSGRICGPLVSRPITDGPRGAVMPVI